MDKLKVFSIPVNIGTYKEFIETLLESARLKKHFYTCVANVHMLVEAYFNKDFANTVQNAQIVTPDGLPLTWAIRLFYGIKQERVAGMDLLPDLLQNAEQKKIPVYFYGGDTDTLNKTSQYIAQNYAGLQVAGMYSPPFRKLSAQEETIVIDNINNSGAQIVFIALGCPKQEKWMASVSERINAVMVGIGGALPVLIGSQVRAPKWVQAAGLEWGFRFFQEPRRLFKRYAFTNSIFIYLFLTSYIRSTFFHPRKNAIDFQS